MAKRDQLKQRSVRSGGSTPPTALELMDSMIGELPQSNSMRDITKATPAGKVQVGRLTFSEIGLEEIPQDLTIDEWQKFGAWIQRFQDAIQWIIGDWAVLGYGYAEAWLPDVEIEGDVPEGRYKMLIHSTDYSYSSLRKFKMMAEKFPVFRRRNTLLYSHHAEVAHLSESEQERFLALAEPTEERDRLSVRDLRELVHADYPPSLPSGLEEFERNFAAFEKKQIKFASSTTRKERRSMALRLRELADKIENEL